MKLAFCKYQGTGNDFIILDNRKEQVPKLSAEQIEQWCHRRFGIGADGLMLLQNKEGYDFEMIYYNSDGRQSSMCGNGGRCIVAFAQQLGVIKDKAHFWAIDGEHQALISAPEYVELQMGNVQNIELYQESDYILDTGSPHYIQFQKNVDAIPVLEEGRAIRYAPRFKADGINVNFVQELEADHLQVATYERGVEAETYSCGTGVTAAALAHYFAKPTTEHQERKIQTKGGALKVRFQQTEGGFEDIWLCGAANFVFGGIVEIAA
ncbi:MAG: diaminopimelate epimerase [Saprospiraceae bacterium]|nr:diaminopimelate epimerase [Saprospiraceae bacterium]